MGYKLSESDVERLRLLHADIAAGYKHLIGFPMAEDFILRELWPFLHFGLNNIGDPYIPPRNNNHTKVLEQEVVAFFSDLFRGAPGEIWGYVTNGGTEGNLCALYTARELYRESIVYFSSATHYSIPKCVHLLGQQGVVVATQPNGEIDYEALGKALAAHRHLPATIVANIGTTMSEAKDDIIKIKQVLQETGIRKYFIHCDGALAAPYTALLDPHHPFDFADGADSIATSGHKFIGSPIPCGVVLVRKIHQTKLNTAVEYVGTYDTTISGSRNGHTPLLLWCAIRKYGHDGLRKRALQGMKLAQYTLDRLQQMQWPSWRNPNALTVMLTTPPAEITARWQLATHHGWSHIICMPGIKRKQIDGLLKSLETADRPPY